MTVPHDPRSIARRRIAVYGALTFAISFALQALIVSRGGPISDHPGLVVALMWTPGLVSIACRLMFREGIRDVSFRLGRERARSYLVAWLFPVVVGLIAYGVAWISGLAAFEAPSESSLGLEGVSPVLRLGISLGLGLTLITLLSAITAAGEELGWRGYLLTRMIDAEVPHPLLVGGLVWGLWHVPLIVSGQYASGPYPALSAVLFLVSIIAGGLVAGYARLTSGSVWPAVLFHSAWNAVIQGSFDEFTRGGGASRTTSIWIGESGVLVAIAAVIVAFVLVRRGIQVRTEPESKPHVLALGRL